MSFIRRWALPLLLAVALAPMTTNAGAQVRAHKTSAGQAVAVRAIAPKAKTVERLTVHLAPSSSAAGVDVGLYSNRRGRPRTLLARCSIAKPQAGAWNSCATTPTRLRAHALYWTVVLQGRGVRGTLRLHSVRHARGFNSRSVSRSLTRLPKRLHARRASLGSWRPALSAASGSTAPDSARSPAGGSSPSPTLRPAPPAAPAPRPPVTSPPAPAGGFPGASNTGIAGCPALNPSGGINVTQNGARIENLDVSGQIYVQAANVTLHCVRVRDTSAYPLRLDGGNNTVVDHVEVDCQQTPNTDAAVMGSSYTLTAVNVHDCGDGIHAGTDVTVQDSYCHDLNMTGAGAHYDCIQLTGCGCFTVKNIVIRHNTLVPRVKDATSAIIIKSDFGPITDVLVDGNLMNYGAYTVYSRDGGSGAPTNVRFTNNRFGRGASFGLHSFDGSVTWSGNVWDDNGAAAP